MSESSDGLGPSRPGRPDADSSGHPERWAQVQDLLDELLDLDPSTRADRLKKASEADPQLAASAAELLEAIDDGPARLFEMPLVESAPEFLAEATEQALQGRSGDRLGSYRLVRVLGRGGMGVVYLAERADEEFEQQVAIKLIPRGLETPEAERRFRLERQVLARLTHPNVAQLIDGGVTEEGYPYLTMEFVEGRPIDEYCDANALDLESRLTLMIAVCRAVQFAHQNLVIHRDLKPANVLVTEEGDVKLLDFGIAKLIEEGEGAESETRVQPRTAAYASPEQIANRPISTASDVYSLGVLLHQSLTDELPRQAGKEETTADTAGGVHRSSRVPPSRAAADRVTWRRRLRGDLDRIVLKALADDPEERYPMAAALGDDLERFLAGEPVAARDPALIYRFRKFVARHRAGVVAAAVTAVALLTALVISLAQTERAQSEASRAERVAGLLRGLFVDANPQGKESGEVTVVELLDRGVERLRTDLEAEPGVRTELMDVLGDAYVGLGYEDRGIPLLEETLEERRRLSGADHPQTADTMRRLGNALIVTGDTDEATVLIEEALATAQEHFGEDSPEIADYLFSLGLLRSAQGDPESQERIFRRLVALHERSDDTTAPMALSLGQLAVALDTLGRAAESLEIQLRALETAEATMGSTHPYTASLRNNLGLRLLEAGDPEEARAHFEAAIAAIESRSGVHEKELMAPLGNLGIALMWLGDFAAARVPIERGAEIARRNYTPDNFRRIGAEINLGTVERELGHLDVAQEIYRDALGRVVTLIGEQHQATARLHCLLGASLAQGGETAAADEFLSAALMVQRSDSGNPSFPDETLVALGRLRLNQGRLDEAESLLVEARELRAELPGDNWRLAEVDAELAALAAARGEPARELAANSLRVLAGSLPVDNFRVKRAMALQGE